MFLQNEQTFLQFICRTQRYVFVVKVKPEALCDLFHMDVIYKPFT